MAEASRLAWAKHEREGESVSPIRPERTSRGRGEQPRQTVGAVLAILVFALTVGAGANVVLLLQGAEADGSGTESTFPAVLRLGGATLVLNGHVRQSFGMVDLYDCAIYTEPGEVSVDSVLSGETPSAMRFDILSSLVAGRMPSRIMALAEATFPADGVARFRDFQSNLREGDVITIVYSPDRGTVLDLNGETILAGQGFAFMAGVLDEWLSPDEHVQRSLSALPEDEAHAPPAVELVESDRHGLIAIPGR